MTTTNDGGIHPMVMKAAKLQFAIDAGISANDAPDAWASFRDEFVRNALKVLTECGALECLEALESIREYWNRDQNETAMADACWHAVNTADETISKVYGSAP